MSGPHRKALETAYPIAYHIQKMSQPGLWPNTFKHCHSYLLYYTHPSVSTYFFYCPAPFTPLVSFIRFRCRHPCLPPVPLSAFAAAALPYRPLLIRFLCRRPCRTARFLYLFSLPSPLPTACSFIRFRCRRPCRTARSLFRFLSFGAALRFTGCHRPI